MNQNNTEKSSNTKNTTLTPPSPSSSSSQTVTFVTWSAEYRNLSIRASTLEKDCIAKRSKCLSKDSSSRKTSSIAAVGRRQRNPRQNSGYHDTSNQSTMSTNTSGSGYFLTPEQYIKRLERLRQICSEAVSSVESLDNYRRHTTTNNDKIRMVENGGIGGSIQQTKRRCKRLVEAYENEYESLMEIYRSEQMISERQRIALEQSLQSIIVDIAGSTGCEIATSPQCGHH